MLGRPSPQAYLRNVLRIIETRALRTSNVDWNVVRSASLELAAGASSTIDTYPAINYALEQLQDNHSFLVDQHGRGTRRKKLSITEQKTQPRAKPRNAIQESNGLFGYIEVKSIESARAAAAKYAVSMQQKIAEVTKRNPSGWIVDLRGNVGGNMWPMIVGVRPVLGSGILGFFQYSNIAIPWFYQQGQAGVINARGKHANFKIDETIDDCANNLPIAILIDASTASSGEAVAISFKERPYTQFFGQHSCGLSTSNEGFKLADGALLNLTTSVEADRNHVLYPSGITPDVFVEQSDSPLCQSADPVIQRALHWLSA